MNEKIYTEKNKVLNGTLYLVGTPIGNLKDMSERAIKILSEVDFIAAEDTRNSMKLLSYFDIHKPMVSYFEHNKSERGGQIIQRLKDGESAALITDAGMPAISDPGEDLVKLCIENSVNVTTIPGPCAAITALTLSGLSTSRFTFEGFLPVKKSERNAILSELKSEKKTMIFHEAPHKLKSTLSDMCTYFGEDRKIALCRELTKLNEEILHFNLKSAIEYYGSNEPRGEFVLVVEGKSCSNCDDEFWKDMSIEEHFNFYLSQNMSKNDAIKSVAKDRKVQKNEIYQKVLDLGR